MTLQIELLEDSFKAIKPDFEEFVSNFYTTLFADHPDISKLFAHTDMPKQRKMLFAALTLVIENLRNPDILESSLTGLGTRHIQYGALPQHYPQFGRTLLKSMKAQLKDDWTPETQQAWVDAYAVLTKLMLTGADYTEETVRLNTDNI